MPPYLIFVKFQKLYKQSIEINEKRDVTVTQFTDSSVTRKDNPERSSQVSILSVFFIIMVV